MQHIERSIVLNREFIKGFMTKVKNASTHFQGYFAFQFDE